MAKSDYVAVSAESLSTLLLKTKTSVYYIFLFLLIYTLCKTIKI